jgi:hypothetical protein
MRWTILLCLMSGCESLRGPVGDEGDPGEPGVNGEPGEKGDNGEQGEPGILDPSQCYLINEKNTLQGIGYTKAEALCDETTEFVLYGSCTFDPPDDLDVLVTTADRPIPDYGKTTPYGWFCYMEADGSDVRAYAYCCPLPTAL